MLVVLRVNANIGDNFVTEIICFEYNIICFEECIFEVCDDVILTRSSQGPHKFVMTSSSQDPHKFGCKNFEVSIIAASFAVLVFSVVAEFQHLSQCAEVLRHPTLCAEAPRHPTHCAEVPRLRTGLLLHC